MNNYLLAFLFLAVGLLSGSLLDRVFHWLTPIQKYYLVACYVPGISTTEPTALLVMAEPRASGGGDIVSDKGAYRMMLGEACEFQSPPDNKETK